MNLPCLATYGMSQARTCGAVAVQNIENANSRILIGIHKMANKCNKTKLTNKAYPLQKYILLKMLGCWMRQVLINLPHCVESKQVFEMILCCRGSGMFLKKQPYKSWDARKKNNTASNKFGTESWKHKDKTRGTLHIYYDTISVLSRQRTHTMKQIPS